MKLKNRNSLKLKPFLSNLINKIRLFLQAIVSVIAKHTTALKPQTVKLGLGLLGSFLIIALLTPIIFNIKSNQNSKALAPQVDRIYPNIGSPAGGDKIIIKGGVFSDQRPIKITQVSAGGSHTCALASNNQAYCWGRGSDGRLGNGLTSNQLTLVQVHQRELPDSAYFTQISAGFTHTCALASNNQAYCWGSKASGQLGNNSDSHWSSHNNLEPSQVHQGQLPASARFTQISSGDSFTCALASDNKTYCWGYNNYGQLGNNSTTNQSTPAQVHQGQLPTSAKFTQISVGNSHTCALASDNKVYCWGAGLDGRLGNNSNSNQSTPAQVHQGQLPTSAKFTQISAGYFHTCALASNDKIYCWGRNSFGQLGNNNIDNQLIPSETHQGQFMSSNRFIESSTGHSHTCSLTSDGKAYCWGEGTFGQLGNNSTTNQLTPVQVHQGQLPASQPGTQVLLNNQPLPIRFIDQHHLEVTMPAHAEGKVDLTIKNPDNTQTIITDAYEYYDSTNKQPTITSLTPNALNTTSSNTQVTLTGANLDAKKWKQISAGDSHTCALDSQGDAYCWGSGSAGQLGNGLFDNNKLFPIRVDKDLLPPSARFTQISSGDRHTCALASDNKAYCWGLASSGQTGNNNTGGHWRRFSTPVQVHQGELPLSAHFIQISAGSNHACALASDNKVYCWGSGNSGQLGNNSDSDQLTPVQVHQGELLISDHFTQISAGSYHTCAISSNGRAYCWGSNQVGQLGQQNISSTENKLTPSEVYTGPLFSSNYFIHISAGFGHTCAISSNGRAYCWGFNGNGQLGNGSPSSKEPMTEVNQGQLPDSSRYIQVSAGNKHTCAVASDDKIYCWGDNFHGQLGNGSSATSSYLPSLVTQDNFDGFSRNSSMSTGGSTESAHTCALASNYRMYCWGNGNDAQLGNGSFGNNNKTLTPARVHDHRLSLQIGAYTLPSTITPTSNTTANFTAPGGNLAIPSSPHVGNAPVSLTRQIDNVASTNQGTLTYYSTPPAPVSLTTHIEKPLNSLRLRWYSPSTGGLDNQANAGNNYSPITDYRVEYCIANTTKDNCQDPSNSNPTTANPSNWLIHSHSPLTSISNGFELSLAIPNLNHTNHYLFRVAAINQAGVGQYIQSQASLPSYVSLSLNQSNLSLNLNPTTTNTYSSAKLTATINTNLNTGYSLKLSTASNNNSLVHTTLPNTQLNSINSTFQNPLPLQANTWGYYIPNTTANQQHNTISYNQFTTNNTVLTNQTTPTTKHSPIPNQANQQTIAQYNQPTTNKQLELIFGVAVDRGQLAGTYQQTIRLEVMGN